MPAFNLQFPGDKSRAIIPDETLFHSDRVKNDARKPQTRDIPQEPYRSQVLEGSFHFHKNITMGDNSGLLLNLRGAQNLYCTEDLSATRFTKSKGIPVSLEETTPFTPNSIEVWAPYFITNPEVTEQLDTPPKTNRAAYQTKYYPATIIKVLKKNWRSSNILVEFNDNQKREVHIADLRKSKPPKRGRGGDKRFLCNFSIWAPPFRKWEKDSVSVDVRRSWVPGQKIENIIIEGLMCSFTLPSDFEKLPWNKEKTVRQFTLKISDDNISDFKYKKREWDKLNEEAQDHSKEFEHHPSPLTRGNEKKNNSGEGKMFDDSPFMHYRANVERANPDGTIVVSWKNGYIDASYDPDLISEDQLDAINYRSPLGGKLYNPPEFEDGEYVNIDYERQGLSVKARIVKKNPDGSYVTSSRYREQYEGFVDNRPGFILGSEVIEEKTPHDVIYKEIDDSWGFRTGNVMTNEPMILPKTVCEAASQWETRKHHNEGRDKVHYLLEKVISHKLQDDGGMVAWMTWFSRSNTEYIIQMCSGKKNYSYKDVSQFCLGKTVDRLTGENRPSIFKWRTPNPITEKDYCLNTTYWKTNCKWMEQITITEDDVKGVPILEAAYKKALMNHGGEDGNAYLIAKYLMEFAEGRVKGSSRRWRAQQFKEGDSDEKTKEEKQLIMLISANKRIEEKNRRLEERMIELEAIVANSEKPQPEKEVYPVGLVGNYLNDYHKSFTERLEHTEKNIQNMLLLGSVLAVFGIAIDLYCK